MYLNLANTCSDLALAGFLGAFQNILKLVQIIGPLLCIISLIILFTNMISNPEDKKAPKKIRNAALALVVVFCVPLLVNVVVSLVDDSSNLKLCWENKIERPDKTATYIEDNIEKKKLTDPVLYEAGEKKKTESLDTDSSITKYVFIGDSRTAQMYGTLNDNWKKRNYSDGGVHIVGEDIYVAQGSMGLNWMKSTGIPAAQKYFLPNTAIIILMGVNDLYNVDNYINYVNSNLESWTSKGSKVYYVSVNPCKGKRKDLNEKITTFNSKVKSNLDSKIKWIDTNSYLKSTGFVSEDGLHYDKDTYKKIHDYIKSKV